MLPDDGTAAALLLCYSDGKPSLALVDPYTGATKPFASPADRAQIAIDAAHRCGDGVILDPHGDYYGISADLSGPMFDLGRYKSNWSAVTRSGLWRPLEPGQFELVTWSGERVRTQQVPAGWSIVGETDAGVVVSNRAAASDRAAGDAFAVVDSGGGVHDLPSAGRVCAVSDRHVVRISNRVDVLIVDLADASLTEVARPDVIEHWWDLEAPVSPSGSQFALTGFTARTADEAARYRMPTILCIVDVETGDLRTGERIDGPQHAVWSASGEALFVGDVYNDRLHIVDPATLEYRTSPAGRRGSSPKVDIGDLAPPLGAAPERVWLAGEHTTSIPRTIAEADEDFESRMAALPDTGMRSRFQSEARPSVRLVRAETQKKRTGTGHTRVGGRQSKVIYAPPGSELTKRSWPRGLPEAGRFREVFLEPAIEITVPFDEERWSVDEWAEAEPFMQSRISGPLHRVLGYPDLVQGYEIGELLVQFDSDAESGVIWGDSGRLYFAVDDLSVLAGDFERVRAHVESG